MPNRKKTDEELSPSGKRMRELRERRKKEAADARVAQELAGSYIRRLLAAVDRAAAAGDAAAQALLEMEQDQRLIPLYDSGPRPPTIGELIRLGKWARGIDERSGTLPPHERAFYEHLAQAGENIFKPTSELF